MAEANKGASVGLATENRGARSSRSAASSPSWRQADRAWCSCARAAMSPFEIDVSELKLDGVAVKAA
jgi:hypothetical protein